MQAGSLTSQGINTQVVFIQELDAPMVVFTLRGGGGGGLGEPRKGSKDDSRYHSVAVL